MGPDWVGHWIRKKAGKPRHQKSPGGVQIHDRGGRRRGISPEGGGQQETPRGRAHTKQKLIFLVEGRPCPA